MENIVSNEATRVQQLLVLCIIKSSNSGYLYNDVHSTISYIKPVKVILFLHRSRLKI